MKRTLAAVSAILMATSTFNINRTAAQQVRDSTPVAYADISDMVIEDELSQHRMLVNQTKAKEKAVEKKQEKEDAGEDASDDKTDGEPDDSSIAGDEEEELESQQGAPEISEEQQEANDAAADSKTEKDFQNKALDTTEDFTPDQFKSVAKKGPKYMMKVKKFGAVSFTFFFCILTLTFLLGNGASRAKSQAIR